MKIETFACDQCKTQKKDANHWFRAAVLVDASIVIRPWESRPLELELKTPEAHLCGAACVSQWVSQNLL